MTGFENVVANYCSILKPIILHAYPAMKMEQCVPKRRHIKFRRREITQKKAYDIQNRMKYPDLARKLSTNMYDIYLCRVYSEKLLMM